jgi:hypothetical protein
MIDLLKQYVDSGIKLSDYQFNKLPRNLLNTYIRRININENQFTEREYKIIASKFDLVDEKNIEGMFAIRGLAIEYFPNTTEQMKKIAVEQNGYSIKFISNPSEELIYKALTSRPKSIQFIDNPTKEQQLFAVNIDGYAIKELYKMGITPSLDIQIAAIKSIPYSISGIPNPSEELQLIAVKIQPNVIRYLRNASDDVQLAAVKEDFSVHKNIYNMKPKTNEYVTQYLKQQYKNSY